MSTMKTVQLGHSDLHVTPICLGTMTFGEQVDEADCPRHPGPLAGARRQLHRHRRDVRRAGRAPRPTAPPRPSSATGLPRTPARAQKLVLATKVAGPSRGMPWIRDGSGMTAADIVASCDDSLRRLQTDVIDLYQIHWPERHVPAFGVVYFDPAKDKPADLDPRAARSPGRAGQGGQGAPHRPVERDALWRARVRAPGRAARPAARGHACRTPTA